MIQQDKTSLVGTVTEIVFQNKENGYTVCKVDCGSDPITMVGIMPDLIPGEEIQVAGDFVTHPVFGRQFAVKSAKRSLPATENAMITYLSAGGIKGIGKKTAERIVDAFGKDTLRVIEKEPEKLSIVKGISKSRAHQIQNRFLSRLSLRAVIEYLAQFEVPGAIAVRAYRVLGEDALTQIRENPYFLCSDLIGVQFETADKIAISQNGSLGGKQRRGAGIVHVLTHNLRNGHTFIPKESLISISAALLQEDIDVVENETDNMLKEGELVYFSEGDNDAVYLPYIYNAEKYIAEKLYALSSNLKSPQINEVDIKSLEEEFSIEYAPLQRKAIARAARGGVIVITGGPGTGKTTIIRGIIKLMERQGKKIALAAPTGRAAKRMSEVCKLEAKTIHRLLEMEYNPYDTITHFARNEKRPIPAQVIIIDECSMVDVQLMEALLRAVRPGTSLILVGDSDQLPSIGAGNVLSDIILCDCVDSIILDEIFRQARESLIVVNAHSINAGEYPSLNTRDSDFFFLSQKDPEGIGYLIVSLCRDRLPKAFNISGVSAVQVITPTKKTPAGTLCLNKLLQEALNPASRSKGQIKINDTVLRLGDKVMQIRNNYDMECIKDDGEIVPGVFNGDVGEIVDMDVKARTVSVRFDDREAEYLPEQLIELELAYAITVHKSQGSEFPIVIIPVCRMPRSLLNRNLLYTAVTRATKMVIMVGDERVIYNMVDNNRRTKRFSGLDTMLTMLFLGE